MAYILRLFIVFLGIWAAAGAIIKFIGRAETISDGMRKIGKAFADWWSNTPPPQVFPVDESEVGTLAKQLARFFDYLEFDCGENADDYLKLVYFCGKCNVSMPVIDAVFTKFLKSFYGFPSEYKLCVDTFICEDRLILIWAKSPNCIAQIQKNRITRAMQGIDRDSDIEE